MRTFNIIDSIYFVYSLSNKTKLMAFKQGNGVNNKTVVKSNILRHTDAEGQPNYDDCSEKNFWEE